MCHTNIFDHSKYVKEYIKAGIPVFGFTDKKEKEFRTKDVQFGGFYIIAFELEHDVRCFGFFIHHKETGKFIFITDTGNIPYQFTDLSQIICEANFCENIVYDLMLNDKLNAAGQNRVESSHLSIQKTLEFLSETDLSKVQNIVLVHLSSQSSNAEQFKRKTELQTGKSVFIADKGVTIDFNLNPF